MSDILLAPVCCDGVIACVQMSSEKPPASGQQLPGPSHAVPQSTSLFRAMNFELFVKPVIFVLSLNLVLFYLFA